MDFFNVSADGLIAYRTDGDVATVTDVEMNLRKIFQERFAVFIFIQMRVQVFRRNVDVMKVTQSLREQRQPYVVFEGVFHFFRLFKAGDINVTHDDPFSPKIM